MLDVTSMVRSLKLWDIASALVRLHPRQIEQESVRRGQLAALRSGAGARQEVQLAEQDAALARVMAEAVEGMRKCGLLK